MARPIEPTPTLFREDAERLRDELAECCSPEESKLRERDARLSLMRWRPSEELEQELADIQSELARRKESK